MFQTLILLVSLSGQWFTRSHTSTKRLRLAFLLLLLLLRPPCPHSQSRLLGQDKITTTTEGAAKFTRREREKIFDWNPAQMMRRPLLSFTSSTLISIVLGVYQAVVLLDFTPERLALCSQCSIPNRGKNSQYFSFYTLGMNIVGSFFPRKDKSYASYLSFKNGLFLPSHKNQFAGGHPDAILKGGSRERERERKKLLFFSPSHQKAAQLRLPQAGQFINLSAPSRRYHDKGRKEEEVPEFIHPFRRSLPISNLHDDDDDDGVEAIVDPNRRYRRGVWERSWPPDTDTIASHRER